MRFAMWLSALALVISLLGHIWVYATYIFRFSFAWTALIVACLVLFALLSLFMLRLFCRRWFVQATPPEWMRQIVRQLAQRLGMYPPDLYILSSEGINAFALGDARTSGAVFFHGHMLAHLTQDEVESVLAHELAHLASGHAMLMTFLQGMTAPLIAPLAGLAGIFISLLFGIRGFKQYFIQVYHMLSMLLFPVTALLIALVMRQWEYAADAQAAQLVGKARYIAALQCLHGSFFQHPDLLNLSAGQPTLDNDQWALSHPSLKQRIHALREVG
jgi:Zn-dependent protease with chaperone function